jgi:arabinogalactan oligomer/maltooligosaccharide transport system permease protein
MGLLLLYLGGTLGANTWLMKGYFDSIPRDLDEAATVDGAGPFQTFWLVILPLVRPILVVVGLLIFISTYSEYVLARIVLTDKFQYTLSVGLNLFIFNQFGQRWGVFSAGALIAALPVVIVFLIFQRYLVGGLTSGAVKG